MSRQPGRSKSARLQERIHRTDRVLVVLHPPSAAHARIMSLAVFALAFVGTVVSETVGANAGLGYQIALAGSNFQMPLVFAALLLLAVEGIAMYAAFAYVEVYFTRWAFRSSMSAAA